jgi:hypothetical protein
MAFCARIFALTVSAACRISTFASADPGYRNGMPLPKRRRSSPMVASSRGISSNGAEVSQVISTA